eukprot:TRINITY_DN11364_c0_g1_i3.p1 TRINITY_DN11364_c0_g1~~TRINITY_DN11364_c0_g1_i3.p1  ORF type:complete len:161 (+),score=47.29 TRINITY_DN11364_c0_g1_i3:468-950(+)
MADEKAPVVKQGGWGEDKPKAGRRAKQEKEEEDERLKMTQAPDLEDEDSEDEIPTIPEAAPETAVEDLTAQIAEAPGANIEIATMADLDKDLATSMSFTQTESGIDLQLLVNQLTPSNQLREDDLAWDFVHLFTEIKSELAIEESTSKTTETRDTLVPIM